MNLLRLTEIWVTDKPVKDYTTFRLRTTKIIHLSD